MLTKNWMTRNVFTINVEDSMSMADKIMKQYKISFLPVLDKGNLVGIITNGDLKRASASEATTLDIFEVAYLIDQIKVGDIMTKKAITISATHTIDEAAEILLEKGISGVPVVDESKKIIGVLTRSDILKVLISLTGMEKRGVDFGFEVADNPGSIKDITDLIRVHNGRIASILISYEQAPVGFRNVYIRVYQIDMKELIFLKKELMKKAKLLYVLDYLGKTKEIY